LVASGLGEDRPPKIYALRIIGAVVPEIEPGPITGEREEAGVSSDAPLRTKIQLRFQKSRHQASWPFRASLQPVFRVRAACPSTADSQPSGVSGCLVRIWTFNRRTAPDREIKVFESPLMKPSPSRTPPKIRSLSGSASGN